MKNLTPEEKKQYRKLIAAAVGFVLVIGILSLLCMPLFRRLSDPGNQEQLRAWIDSLGFTGWLILLGVQILQIVIAFIPGKIGPNAYGPDPKPAPTYEGYGQI